MGAFILRRILWTIPVVLLATALTFVLVKQLPTPFENNAKLPEQVRANLMAKFGLDEPAWKQYVNYVVDMLHGDFGISTKAGNVPVTEIIAASLPTSIALGLMAFTFALVVGTIAGVVSSLFPNRWPDYAITLATTIAFAIPSFLLAKYAVEYLPDWSIGWDDWQSKVMPVLVLGLGIMPYFTRIVRASMLETLQAEFIVTARSKGLSKRTTVIRHVVRNSMIPMVTNSGPLLGFILTGSFIIESIMDIPGIANDFIKAFRDPLDTNMVMATTILVSVAIIFANLIADVIVAWLDPRISHD